MKFGSLWLNDCWKLKSIQSNPGILVVISLYKFKKCLYIHICAGVALLFMVCSSMYDILSWYEGVHIIRALAEIDKSFCFVSVLECSRFLNYSIGLSIRLRLLFEVIRLG